jgi:hypothetical protein
MEHTQEQPIRQIYCEKCGAFEELVETSLMNLPVRGVEYYELICGACSRVIAIVQVSASASPDESGVRLIPPLRIAS